MRTAKTSELPLLLNSGGIEAEHHEFIFGAQIGHDLGAFADARIVVNCDGLRVGLAVNGETLQRVDAGKSLPGKQELGVTKPPGATFIWFSRSRLKAGESS